MPKKIREKGAQVALPFDNVSDFFEVDVPEVMLVGATFFWLDVNDFDIRKILMLDLDLLLFIGPTGNNSIKCFVENPRVGGYVHEFNPRCGETM